ncbi:MAG: hypothetical protein WBN75_12900 [Verrucomicrobiia bacterium]
MIEIRSSDLISAWLQAGLQSQSCMTLCMSRCIIIISRIRAMTWKQLDARFSEWFLKPLVMVAHSFRTNCWLDGQTITVKRPFSRPISVRLEEIDEIGVETTDQGPFVEDVFWILKRGEMRIRIGDPHPVFKMLVDRFGLLEGFDWRPFTEAMICSDNRYFLCWRRSHVPG